MYHELFPNRAIFPVVHVQSRSQALDNLRMVAASQADGAFVIHHGLISTDSLMALYAEVLAARDSGELNRPDTNEPLWLGLNLLGHPNLKTIRLGGEMGFDGIWCDNAGYFGESHALASWNGTLDIELSHLQRHAPGALYFGGVAHKGALQPGNEDLAAVAQAAAGYLDVITTSGPQTGQPASLDKLRRLREAIDDHPLAVASGIDLGNVKHQLQYVDAVLVASSICRDGDPHNFDAIKLQRLIGAVREFQPSA